MSLTLLTSKLLSKETEERLVQPKKRVQILTPIEKVHLPTNLSYQRQSRLFLTRTYAHLRTKGGYKDIHYGDLDAIEEEGPKLEEFEKGDEDRCQILEECQAKINKKYGYGTYNKEFQYGGNFMTNKGPKMSASTIDTSKGKRKAHHNRDGSWFASQSEREDYSHKAQHRQDLKYLKRKPITTPTRFYREDPLLPTVYSDKNCQYLPKNRQSHNGSFSERLNMSETGSFGRLRQSYGKGLERGAHLKSSFQGSFPSERTEDPLSENKKSHNGEEKEFPNVNSAERLGNNVRRRCQPIDRSVEYKIDIDKVGVCHRR